MPRKRTPKRPSRADRAAEGADFKAWLADAVAALQREHNVNPGTIPARVWRHLYIKGRAPQEAADQAALRAVADHAGQIAIEYSIRGLAVGH